MKLRSKIISAIITLSLILSLAACGSKDVSGNVTAPETKTDANETADNSPAPEEATFNIGSTDGGTYTNDYLGIGCKLDETWTFYDEKQLADLNGVVVDSIDNKELADKYSESLESGKTVFDMYATSSDGLAQINIVIENLGVIYGNTIDESSYVDLSMDTLKETLDSAGMTNTTVEKISIDCAGATRSGFAASGESEGIAIYEKGICIKKGNYMAIITVSSYTQDTTDTLASLFYSL